MFFGHIDWVWAWSLLSYDKASTFARQVTAMKPFILTGCSISGTISMSIDRRAGHG